MYSLPDCLSIYLSVSPSVCMLIFKDTPARDAVEKRLRMSQLWVNFCFKLHHLCCLLLHLANI